LPANATALVDDWLLRYARLYVLREIGPDAPLAPSTIRALALRVSVLRILTLGDPSIAIAPAPLAERFIAFTYRIARLADHAHEVATALAGGADVLLTTSFEIAGLLRFAFSA
jgi:hypothetical protein